MPLYKVVIIFLVVDGIPLSFIVLMFVICLKADGTALLYTLVDVVTNVADLNYV